MPVKRRIAKRRLDPAAEVEAWASVFDSGHDFFGDLRGIGVETDAYGKPIDHLLAADAWRRLGPTHLVNNAEYDRRYPRPHPRWAVAEFGEPPCR